MYLQLAFVKDLGQASSDEDTWGQGMSDLAHGTQLANDSINSKKIECKLPSLILTYFLLAIWEYYTFYFLHGILVSDETIDNLAICY